MILGLAGNLEACDSLENGTNTGTVDEGTETQTSYDAGWKTYWSKEEDTNITFKYTFHTVMYNVMKPGVRHCM